MAMCTNWTFVLLKKCTPHKVYMQKSKNIRLPWWRPICRNVLVHFLTFTMQVIEIKHYLTFLPQELPWFPFFSAITGNDEFASTTKVAKVLQHHQSWCVCVPHKHHSDRGGSPHHDNDTRNHTGDIFYFAGLGIYQLIPLCKLPICDHTNRFYLFC